MRVGFVCFVHCSTPSTKYLAPSRCSATLWWIDGWITFSVTVQKTPQQRVIMILAWVSGSPGSHWLSLKKENPRRRWRTHMTHVRRGPCAGGEDRPYSRCHMQGDGWEWASGYRTLWFESCVYLVLTLGIWQVVSHSCSFWEDILPSS